MGEEVGVLWMVDGMFERLGCEDVVEVEGDVVERRGWWELWRSGRWRIMIDDML